MPEIYSEAKKAQDVALRSSLPVIEEVWREWGAVSGRTYKPVETYRCDDAEVAFVAMGSLCQTAEVAVDTLRERGVKAGLVKIRLWRPLPDVELKAVLSRFKRLLIVDRAYSFGAFAGPVATEIGMLLYTADRKPELFNFIAGLGGRDVPMKSFVEMFETAERDSGTGRQKNFYTLEVRE